MLWIEAAIESSEMRTEDQCMKSRYGIKLVLLYITQHILAKTRTWWPAWMARSLALVELPSTTTWKRSRLYNDKDAYRYTS